MTKPRFAVTVWRPPTGTVYVTWPKVVRGAVALGDESVAWHWASRKEALAWCKATLGNPSEVQVVPYTFRMPVEVPQHTEHPTTAPGGA